MPRNKRVDPEEFENAISQLMKHGNDAPPVAHKLDLLRGMRTGSPQTADALDNFFVKQLAQTGRAIAEAQETHEQLKAVVEQLNNPPWHPARLIRIVATRVGPRPLVLCGSSEHIVECVEEVEIGELGEGDMVYLNSQRNLIMDRADGDRRQCGETAAFERVTDDGRIVLLWRDEQLVVDCARQLDPAGLERGQLIRWDRSCLMAFEAIERTEGEEYFFDDVEDIGPEAVGGQSEALNRMITVLTARLVDPDGAKLYGIRGKRAILLHGQPGVGKTLLSRVCAAQIKRLTGRRCVFAVVRPGEWLNPYVGTTEANIRNTFAALRKAAGNDTAVLFLDEVESIASRRGRAEGHHDDKFLATLLAEIDGFSDRGNIAVIAATNRKDLLDSAAVDRLCGTDIEVKRPDRHGAREIFGIHLSAQLYYHSNGIAPEDTRDEMIDRAVSRLYDPNADNDVCRIQCRDGSGRTVNAAELVSGRIIEQICTNACDHAFERHSAGAGEGLRVADIDHAVSETLTSMRSLITVRNVHAYLDDLTQDMEVVKVESVQPKVADGHTYLAYDMGLHS